MSPFLILLVGMLVVVGGILALRLHAFLALVLGALVVASLAAPDAIYRSQFKPAERVALFGEDRPLEEVTPANADLEGQDLALVGKHAVAVKKSESSFIDRVTAGLGNGFSKLAIIIAMAAIIGKCLLDSGAAERIVLTLRNALGEKRTPVAFSASAFTLGIPVFFDTVFYLLMPLGKALRLQTGRNYTLYILSIVCGATMAHSLVPPTPGPLTVVSFFDDVTVGQMMIGGLIVGLVTVSAGFAYAHWANRRWDIPLRDAEALEDGGTTADREGERELPAFWISLLPILLPVVLIAGWTCADAFGVKSLFLETIGDKNIALVLSAGVALGMLAWSKRRSIRDLGDSVQAALASGGVIILITSAGSAFGGALRDTGIADSVADLVPESQSLLLIPLAWAITAAIRTAQGSATVAMITAGSIVAPVAAGVALSFHPVYLALAIGCGSKPIMWANDSGFWIIGRMSGMTPLETFKTASLQMIVMSVTGLVVILAGAALLPLK